MIRNVSVMLLVLLSSCAAMSEPFERSDIEFPALTRTMTIIPVEMLRTKAGHVSSVSRVLHHVVVLKSSLWDAHTLSVFDGSVRKLSWPSELGIRDLADAISVECGSVHKFSVRHQQQGNGDIDFVAGDIMLPHLWPHNESALARFLFSKFPIPTKIFPADQESASRVPMSLVLVLSRGVDNEGFKHPIISPAVLASCHLSVQSPQQQRNWPIISVLDSSNRLLTGDYALTDYVEMPQDESQSLTTETAASVALSAPAFYLDVRSDTKRCQLAAIHDRHAADGKFISLLQVQSFHKFVSPALKAVMDPLLGKVLGNVGREIQAMTTSTVVPALLQNTPPQVIDLAEDPMKINISSLVTDAVTERTASRLVDSLSTTLTPDLSTKITSSVTPDLHALLEPLLKEQISADLIKIIPTLIERAIKVQLTPRLVNSMTHALTPAITMSVGLMVDEGNQHWCQLCTYRQMFCSKCRASVEANYYTIYYAAYYSDYYATFYGTYYTNSLVLLDGVLNPEQAITVT